MKTKEQLIKYCIIIVLTIGLAICIAMLFPHVRQMIIRFGERLLHRETSIYQEWFSMLLSYAIGGILLIILSGYCLLTASGKTLARKMKNEIRDCLSEINWRSFIKPVLLMSGVYLLGIMTIIRANLLYNDDIWRSIIGIGRWYDWSRYVSELFSIFIHADFHLTDISPVPQLLAIFFLAVSSVLLVYVLNNRKITIIALLASIPLGLSPYMLECLSYRFDSPYMALSVLASVVPFLFLSNKKAFIFCSIISLLIMCMTYQAASGIYLLITLFLCFKDWNYKQKTNREVFIFLGQAVLSFCVAMALFKLFLMKPSDSYVSTATASLQQLFSSVLTNIQTYANFINSDFGFIWKALIGVIFCFFIAKSVFTSAQNKMISFLAAIIFLGLLFVLSYGIYLALMKSLFFPRAMYGFGVFLAIISIYIASNFNRIAKIAAFALSWSFFVFAFSYGNALADQMRYINFRAGILLQDLSALYPNENENGIKLQLNNTIGFTPLVRNIAKHNPVIYRLVPEMMRDDMFTYFYLLSYFNYAPFNTANLNLESVNREGEQYVDFITLDLPVVLKTYFHTIRSDGKRVLVELNEGVK